jgi:hypothetical protein
MTDRFKKARTIFALSIVAVLICGTAGHLRASGKTGIWHEEGHGTDLSFASYTLGSNEGAIVLDGRITNDDKLGLPFSRQQRGGKRGAPMMGWVKDDGDNLYISLHISASSRSRATSGGAKVFIKQPGGMLEFNVGMSGRFDAFEGKRKHRVFEFKIPLVDIKVSEGAVELAFAMDGAARG